MNQQDHLKKKAVKNISECFNEAYKVKRNQVNKLIKMAKTQYCKQSIDLNKNNPKEMWRNINQVISGKGRCSKTTIITTVKDDHDQTIHNEKLIANICIVHPLKNI